MPLAPSRARPGAAVALLLAGLACSAPGLPRAPEGFASPYFPLVPGARWEYELDAGLFRSGWLVATARGERAVAGLQSPLFVVEERSSGGLLGLPERGWVGYRVRRGFVERLAGLAEDASGRFRAVGGLPVPILPVAPEAGEAFGVEGRVFGFEGAPSGAQRWELEVSRPGRVRVEAGTFRDVVRVESALRDPDLSGSPVLVRYVDDYARGVGLVRSVTRAQDRRLEQRLVAVSFPEPAAPQ